MLKLELIGQPQPDRHTADIDVCCVFDPEVDRAMSHEVDGRQVPAIFGTSLTSREFESLIA
ncbi:hypothetical protein NN3_05520 [Nocardia neocaledoniensis NBRC 108232]|nr:hypothetical protein NN3_05520 [Nocardia neocaledoniensis NBRC 108232]